MIITGGFSGVDSDLIGSASGVVFYDYVLEFSPEDGSWSQLGQLQVARAEHGASKIHVDDISYY